MILTIYHYNYHDNNTFTVFDNERLIRNILNLNFRQNGFNELEFVNRARKLRHGLECFISMKR